jgi:hypothetical protein
MWVMSRKVTGYEYHLMVKVQDSLDKKDRKNRWLISQRKQRTK